MSVKNIIKDNYNMMLLKDYLRESIKDAGFSGVDMSKTPMGTKVTLHVTRPGIVIGRKGSGIKVITEVLATKFGLKNPQIMVEEIKVPELSPSVMCNRIATHIMRGVAFRRATMWTLKQIMENGAMGVQITISGKLRGERSAFEKHTQGILPRAGHHADVIVSEDVTQVPTPMGLIGVKIRIARKERYVKEFEMKTPQPGDKKQAKEEQGAGDAEGEKDVKGADKTEGVQTQKEKQPEVKEKKPKTESEQIELEAEKMKEMERADEEVAK